MQANSIINSEEVRARFWPLAAYYPRQLTANCNRSHPQSYHPLATEPAALLWLQIGQAIVRLWSSN